jgi:hypothetical protein
MLGFFALGPFLGRVDLLTGESAPREIVKQAIHVVALFRVLLVPGAIAQSLNGDVGLFQIQARSALFL